MKNITRILAAMAVVCLAVTVPVKADLASEQAAFNSMMAQIQARDAAANAAHQALYDQQRINNIVADAQNYSNYLYQVVVNDTETTRIKKEIVDNYTALSRVNPQFGALIAPATVDYNNALAKQMADKAHADKVKAFAYSDQVKIFADYAKDSYKGALYAGEFVENSLKAMGL
ncbi:MAG: hypothetical protein K6B28_08585 [Lachnospiraceae bacterium]|nr:hypothetical protein [Lachnospiraceae bacterium]